MSDMSAQLILATRPAEGVEVGLITFLLECPVYIWTELLTHRLSARNASSSRAQSATRHQAHGYYTPPVFYEVGEFMQSGMALPLVVQAGVRQRWQDAHEGMYDAVREIDEYVKSFGLRGLSKEQINRPLPTTKMVRGVLTMTEAGWASFFGLRYHPTADTAMQILAELIYDTPVEWQHGLYHVPFSDGVVRDNGHYHTQAPIAAARLARTSVDRPKVGKTDEELSQKLLADKHLSPFEHVCEFVELPLASALACRPADLDKNGWGWQTYRSVVEQNNPEMADMQPELPRE